MPKKSNKTKVIRQTPVLPDVSSSKRTEVKNNFSIFNAVLKPQIIFLVLASTFGLGFVFIIPPFQVPDESAHLFRAYQLSKFELKIESRNNVYGNNRPPAPNNIVQGIYLPAAFDSIQKLFYPLRFKSGNKTSMKAILDACSAKTEPDKVKFTEMTSPYSFFSYLPHLPAIYIGRILNLNVIHLLYLGRIFALIFYIWSVWYSIKITPIGKNLFLALALIPMTLSQSGSFSADCVTFSFSFLALAVAFELMMKKNLNIKNTKLILFVLMLCLSGVFKPNYFPFVFLILLIPKSAFEKRAEYYYTVFFTFIVSLLLMLGWIFLSSANQIKNPDFAVYDILETPSYQLGRILNNPWSLFEILKLTVTAKYEFLYKGLIGILGYLDTRIPTWIYLFYFKLLLVVALLDFNKTVRFFAFQRLIILIPPLGVVMATIYAMFLIDGAESRQSLVAAGVQGRYFIPALIAFYFVFYRIFPLKTSIFENNKIVSFILFIICMIILYQTEYAVYLRYYISGNEYYRYIN